MIKDKPNDCAVYCGLVTDKGCGVCTPNKNCLDCRHCVGDSCGLNNLDDVNENTFCLEFEAKSHG